MGLALAAYADDSHAGACRNLEVQTARACLSGIEQNAGSIGIRFGIQGLSGCG